MGIICSPSDDEASRSRELSLMIADVKTAKTRCGRAKNEPSLLRPMSLAAMLEI